MTFSVLHGKWWRYSSYEIRDRRICPCEGAELQSYEPRGWIENKDWERPYLGLFNLAHKYAPAKRKYTAEETASLENAIVSWCNQFGLLGILPHYTNKIILPQNTVKSLSSPSQRLGWFEDELQSTVIYRRGVDKWCKLEDPYDTLTEPCVEFRNGTVPFDYFLNTENSEIEYLRWFDYFPETDSSTLMNSNFPIPLSMQFWEIYAEPVDQFLTTARLFYECFFPTIAAASPIKSPSGTFRPMPIDYTEIETKSDELFSSVAPCIRTSHGDFEFRISFTSLIGALAALTSMDVTTTASHIRRCEVCGSFFRASRSDARFDTDQCRNTASKRRVRAGIKKSQGIHSPSGRRK